METVALSREDAEKLNFVPPARPQTAAETRVVGYYNPNPWPVHIANSALGISLTLLNKGDYIVDERGTKINDPRLDQYCGPNQLAKEIGDNVIPVYCVPERIHATSSPTGFSATHKINRDKDGNFVEPALPKFLEPPSNSHSVTSMSMEDARRMGLIEQKSRSVNFDDGVGHDAKPQSIPTLKIPPYPKTKAVSSLPNPVENAEQAKIVESLRPAALPDALKSIIEDGDDLPPPILDDEPSPINKFVAPDGKSFKYRSELERYVMRNFSSQAEAYMAQYPKKT